MVSAMSIVNDLHYADGRQVKNVTGGGLFMLGGVLSYTADVGFVTAAGTDFEEYHGEFFRRNGLGTEGVHRTLPHTHYTTVTYFPDHTKAVYTESGSEELFWNPEEVAAVRAAAPQAKIMWEVPHYNTFDPLQKPLIWPALEQVDLFSVNLREARELFGVQEEKEVLRAIRSTGKSCFLRFGVEGSCAILPGQPAMFVPSIGLERTVDPTGCGNCSTAAAMVGMAEGFEPARIAAFANVAADYNALQLGPYPLFSEGLRAKMAAEANELAQKARILEE